MLKVFRAWPVLLVAAGLGFLAARGLFWSYTIEEEHKESYFTEEKPVIEVEVFNGSVKITQSKGRELHVRLVKRAVGSDKPDAEKVLEKLQVRLEQVSPTRFVFTGKQNDPFYHGDSGVYADLQVPLDADVKLVTSNAGISVDGIQGAITAKASNGSVTVKGNQGPVKVQTTNSSIRINDGRGKLDLQTTNGSITVKAVQATLQAKTSHSSINFQGTLEDGEHSLVTSHSRIEVKLPPESHFKVDATASNGKITSDFEVQSAPGTKPSRKPVKLQGTIGSNPRYTLKLQTSHSSIALKHGTPTAEEDE
jgi:hypothetical protein